MAFWDTLNVGDPIPDLNTYFIGGYESDYTQPLGGGILGTTIGYQGDPFGGMTYPTDGQYKMGPHLQLHQTYATGYIGRVHVTSQVNNEQNHYRQPHTPGLDPNYLSSYANPGGHFRILARQSTQAEQDAFCQFKGYLLGSNGQAGKSLYLRNKFGRQTLLDWGAAASAVDNNDATPFFHEAPAHLLSGQASTLNRKSMSFGRTQARLTAPFGARIVGPQDGDLSRVQAYFPAYWTLEAPVAGTDLNTRQHAADTHTPGNPSAGGQLPELDSLELFWDDTVHVTSHLHFDGDLTRGGVQVLNGKSTWRSDTKLLNTVQNPVKKMVRDVHAEVGHDRYPPSAGYPNGVIMYHFNNAIIAIQPMSPYMGQPKILYEPIGGEYPYLPYVDPNTALVRRLGTQVYADGNPAYMKYYDLFNIADLASFARIQAYNAVVAGTAPSYRENEVMDVDWHIMKPLNPDFNPDTNPFVDHTAGEFGGSGPGTGIVTPPGGGIDPTTPYTPRPSRGDPFPSHPVAAVNRQALRATVELPPNDDGTQPTPGEYTFLWTASAGVTFLGPTDEYAVEVMMADAADDTEVGRTLTCTVTRL